MMCTETRIAYRRSWLIEKAADLLQKRDVNLARFELKCSICSKGPRECLCLNLCPFCGEGQNNRPCGCG